MSFRAARFLFCYITFTHFPVSICMLVPVVNVMSFPLLYCSCVNKVCVLAKQCFYFFAAHSYDYVTGNVA